MRSFNPRTSGAADAHHTRRRLRSLAHFLDSAIPLPGGGRIGFDGIIGLIPGIGDALGALISSYIVSEAARLRVPAPVLIAMTGNVLLETVIGVIPLAGDLFDMGFKANQRNVALMERYLDNPTTTTRRSRRYVWALLLVVALAVVGALYLIFALVGAVWGLLT